MLCFECEPASAFQEFGCDSGDWTCVRRIVVRSKGKPSHYICDSQGSGSTTSLWDTRTINLTRSIRYAEMIYLITYSRLTIEHDEGLVCPSHVHNLFFIPSV